MPAKKEKKEEKVKIEKVGETKPKRVCKPRKKVEEAKPEKEQKATSELSAKSSKTVTVDEKPKVESK
ncbi:MAG: hypothetical protein WHV60_09995, partial [Bacteroidota bacterium]